METKLKSQLSFPVVAIGAAVTLIAALSLWKAHALAGGLTAAVLSVDYRIVLFLNHYAHRSWTLDTFFYIIDSNSLASAPLLMGFWWAWFKDDDREQQTRTREILLYGIVGTFLLILILRALDMAMPYRGRPLHNPELHFVLPYGIQPDRLLGWSSFPSDHAVLWFFLAATVFYVSRRVGIFLIAYVCLTLCVARVYLGIHYPSDIAAGAIIGVGAAGLCKYPAIRKTMAEQPLRWLQRAPGVFYAVFFVVTSQMTEGFNSLHELQAFAHAAAKSLVKVL